MTTSPAHSPSLHYRSCPLCEAACGLEIATRGADIVAITGDRADPASRGHICAKGAALAELQGDPDRLRRPLKRVGNDWHELDWDEAFDLVAHRLKLTQRAYGNDAVGVFQGNPTVHNLGLLIHGQLFLRRLGTRNMYSSTSADQLPHMLSSLLMLGSQFLLPVPDIDHTDFFLALGANPLVSGGSLMTAPGMRRRLRELRERGGKLVVIDPRRSETARVADQHLFITPGSDALFLLALLHSLFAEGLAQPLTRVAGEAALRDLVEAYPPELVAPIVAIDAATIRELARSFASARTAVCYGRMGVSTQEFGGLCSWLINLVNIVTGNFDRRGGAMFATPAIDIGKLGARVGFAGSFARWHSRVRGLPEFGEELPAVTLAEEIETPGASQVRALITCAGNPVLSLPNGRRLDRALASLDFMVSIDFYLNETTRHASVILPPTSPLERDHYDLGLAAVSVRNVAKYSAALFPRAADQRHDWEIAVELASRMETNDRWWGKRAGHLLRLAGMRLPPRSVIALGLRTGPYAGRLGRKLSLAKLEANPHGVDLGPLEPRLADCLATPDKLIQLVPDPYAEDLARLRARLVDRAPSPGDELPLALIGRRHLRSDNSWLHNLPGLVTGKPRCTLLIHPDDAAARELVSGDRAELRSRLGAITVPVEVSDEVMPGVVSLPHGWGHDRPGIRLSVASAHAGVSVNDIIDEDEVDLMSGNASFSGIRVEVSKL